MKRNNYINLLFAGALAFGSCNVEPDFDGLEDMTKPTNVKKYEEVYQGKVFNAENPAQATIPAWLNSKYYTCDKGSTAIVSYLFETSGVAASYVEDFEGNYVSNEPAQIPGWLNWQTAGDATSLWKNATYNSNTYVQYNPGKSPVEATLWMISPKLAVEKGDSLTFDLTVGYWNQDCLDILVSTTFQGNSGSITNKYTKWISLTEQFNIPQEPSNGYGVMGNAGSVSLDEFAGQELYVAFRYTDAEGNSKTVIQIDNVGIKKGIKKQTEESDEYIFNGTEWVFERTIPKAALKEDFERKVTDKENTMLPGWINAALEGDKKWIDKSYGGNVYTECSAYKIEGLVDAWLITPQLEIKEGYVMKFDMTSGHWTHEALSVLVSSDFSGKEEDVANAKWEDITEQAEYPKVEGAYGKPTEVGPFDFSKYAGKKIYVAFRYKGNAAANETSTVQLDNVYVGQ
ncbi:MAG: choice-of-anchor J domain-containing protein [Bacteroidales bacterium]